MGNLISMSRILFILLFSLLLYNCAEYNIEEISLEKINIDIPQKSVSTLQINEKYFTFFVVGGNRGISLLDRSKGNDYSYLDLLEIGLKKFKMFVINSKDELWFAKREKYVKDKKELPELAKTSIHGNILLRRNLPFDPQSILCIDTTLFLIGYHNGKFIHRFNSNGIYLKSIININEDDLEPFFWLLSATATENKIFIADAKYFRIWVIESDSLIKIIKYRDNGDLIKIENVSGKKKIYRNKGIHNVLVHNGKLYISCFEHGKYIKSFFWYDIVDLKNGKLLRSVKTDFLYYFASDGKTNYVFHNVPEFELFKIKFQ